MRYYLVLHNRAISLPLFNLFIPSAANCFSTRFIASEKLEAPKS